MNASELKRLAAAEEKIRRIAEEEGLCVPPNIIFEVVPARRMIEAMAYNFPTNFSHWSFGRDYDYHRTIYDHSGGGIPYEQVWNFDTPKALLVDTNPFALNVLTMAHVVAHVDFFMKNRYTSHRKTFADIAEEARFAAERFRGYESKHGEDKVEAIIDAGMSLQWLQPHDPLTEEPNDADARNYLIDRIKEKIRYAQTQMRGAGTAGAAADMRELERELARVRHATPPEPVHDVLKYIILRGSRLKQWERDVLSVIRNQARALAPNRRTQMLNEGWATYWHTRIMRRLFREGFLTSDEHAVFTEFHGKVTQKNFVHFNVYSIGPALYDYAEEVWNKGRFGQAFDECRDPVLKAAWDTGAKKGREKIFQIRSSYTDHMAITEFFTPEFIHALELYFYEARTDEDKGVIEYVITEKNPEVIRQTLMLIRSLFGMPEIVIADGNYGSRGELYLRHNYVGEELEDQYARGTLRHAFYAWRLPVHLETVVDKKPVFYTCDGKSVFIKTEKKEEPPDDDYFGMPDLDYI